MPYTSRVQRQDVQVEEVNGTQTGTILPAGLEIYVITPPADEIWQILSWRLNIANPAGSGAGAHILQFQSTNLGALGLIYFYKTVAFGNALNIDYNTGWDQPSDIEIQMDTMLSLIATATDPLELKYSNNTDVNQTGDRKYLLLLRKTKVI